MAQVKIHGITKEYPEGTTWMEVVREHQKEYEYDILLVRVNGKLQELHKQVKDCELSFVTAKDKPGMSAYQRSASLMMLKAFYSVAGPGNVEKLMIDFSIGRGFFVEARGNFVLDQEFLDAVKAKMREYVERKIPIMKRSVSTDDAIELFEKLGMYDKARLFRYRMVSRVNIYSIDGFEDYYYGYMVQNTGYIKHFDLIPYHYGFVMVMPDRKTPDVLRKLAPSDKLFATLS